MLVAGMPHFHEKTATLLLEVSTSPGFPRLPHGSHVFDGFSKGRTIDVWLQRAGIEQKTLRGVLARTGNFLAL